MTSSEIFSLAFIIFLIYTLVKILFRRKPKNDNDDSEKVTPMTEWDIQCMAYHEAGHAVCSFFLPEREPLQKITIVPGDKAFGMIQTAARLHHNETETSLKSSIITFLAGPMSEEYFIHQKTTSGIHDYFSARQIATGMVTSFGMGKTLKQFVSVYDDTYLLYGEKMGDSVDSDVRSILEEATDECQLLIKKHASTIEQLACLLLKRRTLKKKEIDSFFKEYHE